MLDTETKRRIDTARDILVGKVPNPASQVEQITIALIYKFMDDMDKEVEELGGKPSFFRGDYAKYSWSKIFDPKLSGFEIVALYGEALDNMNLNPDIPPLFREIFKNAFLPYRDPETLKSFLKIINEFNYTHSEKLGDAYEYLLSIMSSQGDAGQFRTPRHIIDFIVEVVNPRKTDKILDPACGTAGFLISSYKHILKSNTKKSKGDMLTPEDKNKLTENLTGYDISPDMVRISLVNMYLHGFSNPKIFEYDTLTSEDRWNEYYDVVLANPPFMSPKGGIRPHKRFSIQAKRSEVLFVDYIAEHLTPSGKAGVIVPEGIIFQSGNAYKNLRKMLVENYLWAVVSLPAGIFNPYSGVKTSILLFDKVLAKSNENILFVKVENDGYDLGAQRRKIDKDDLPAAKVLLKEYIKGKTDDTNHKDINYLIVQKQKISENGDYNLSMDRYRENEEKRFIKYKFINLGDVVDIFDNKRKPITKSDRIIGYYPYYGATGILDYINDYIFDERLVLVGEDGAKWGKNEKTAFIANGKYWVNNHAHVLKPKINLIIDTFLVEILNIMDLQRYVTGITVPKLNQQKLKEILIPLPPLEVQQEIVNKIESYQKIIDGAKQIIENYKPEIDINPDWEKVKVKDICEINPKKSEIIKLSNSTLISFVPMADLEENQIYFDVKVIKELGEVYSGYTYFRDNDVLLAKVTPCFENGKAGIARNLKNGIGFGSSEYYIFRASKKVLPEWIYLNISSNDFKKLGKESMTGTGGLQRIPRDFVSNYQISLPPLQLQQQIVDRIEREQKLIEANKELVKIYEQKIKDEINKVWEG